MSTTTASNQEPCPVCGTTEPCFTWTDAHGVAQCVCGVPYRIIHYDDENNRVPGPPECLVLDEWVPRLKRFREETGRVIPSGCSIPGGQERATASDIREFNAWCDKNVANLPQGDGGQQ